MPVTLGHQSYHSSKRVNYGYVDSGSFNPRDHIVLWYDPDIAVKIEKIILHAIIAYDTNDAGNYRVGTPADPDHYVADFNIDDGSSATYDMGAIGDEVELTLLPTADLVPAGTPVIFDGSNSASAIGDFMVCIVVSPIEDPDPNRTLNTKEA